jgi:hypothetical protein
VFQRAANDSKLPAVSEGEQAVDKVEVVEEGLEGLPSSLTPLAQRDVDIMNLLSSTFVIRPAVSAHEQDEGAAVPRFA